VSLSFLFSPLNSSQKHPSTPPHPHHQTDEVEERLVNEEYKIWKKNTPFLYGESD
jgi:hypothetical protein